MSPYPSNTEHWTKYACSCKGSQNRFRFALEIKDFAIQIWYAWTGSQRWYGFCTINEESIDEYSICPEQINFNKMQVVNANLKQPKTISPGLGKLQYQNISE